MDASEVEPRLCRLEKAVGPASPCPEDRCPFWEPGGAVLEGRCVFEGISFSSDRDVAEWLLSVRKELETETPGSGE